MNQLSHQGSVTANIHHINQIQVLSSPKQSCGFRKNGGLNHHDFDIVDVQVHPSDYSFEYNPESVTYTDKTLIKSVDDDKMYHIPQFFYLEQDDYILDVYLYMLEA